MSAESTPQRKSYKKDKNNSEILEAAWEHLEKRKTTRHSTSPYSKQPEQHQNRVDSNLLTE